MFTLPEGSGEEIDMRSWGSFLAGAALLVSASAQAATFSFAEEPFFENDAPTTPGRQIVGGETFITFNPAADTFSLQGSAFEALAPLSFFNGVIADVPPAGTNVVVLRTFDNDGDAGTPFGAGNAATLIADRITTSAPGLFVYFNSNLNLPRLVYSTDLSDSAADLQVLFRMTNLTGPDGQAAMQLFTAENFTVSAAPIPEPSTWALLGSGAALLAFVRRRGQGRNRRNSA
jgi:hypothetical protein